MDFEFGPAILAGLIAGAIMEGPVYLQKVLGLPVKQNIFRTWGRMFGLRGNTTGTYLVGMAFHEVLAAAIAVVYALGFDVLGIEGNLWIWGIVGALVHYTLAGPVVAMLPSQDPDTGEERRQGFAYKNYGTLDVATSFAGHLTFGLLTAILYGLLRSDGGTNIVF